MERHTLDVIENGKINTRTRIDVCCAWWADLHTSRIQTMKWHLGNVALQVFFVCCTSSPIICGEPSRFAHSSHSQDGGNNLAGVSATERVQAIKKMLDDANMQTLREYASAADDTLSIASGWSRLWKSVDGLAEKWPMSPPSDALQRFLGLVEGRIKCNIPTFWEDLLKEMKQNRDGTQYLRKLEEWHSNQEVSIREDNGRAVVRGDEFSITLKRNFPTEMESPQARCTLDSKVAFVAVFDQVPTPFELVAVDTATQRTIWSSQVSADGGEISYLGPGAWHEVYLVRTETAIIAFGVANNLAYFEAFDANTGKPLAQFRSDLLSVR